MSAAESLAHRVAGDGEPVVLLNGGMMSFASWEPLATSLREPRADPESPGHRLLGFDFRGQLLSPGTPPPDLAGHASDVVGLLDSLGWGAAHLVGASFGAEVAIELAAAHPARVRSLVAITAMDRVTPEFRRDSDEMRVILAAVRAGGERTRFHDTLIEGVYSPAYRREQAAVLAARRAQLDRIPAPWFEGVDGLLAALETFDLRERAAAVRCPSLVVIAAADRVMPPERSRVLASLLRAEVVEHPTAGHALVAEDPEWLARALLDFLARHAAPAADPVAAR